MTFICERMKVLFITNIPSPYRIKFFNELGKYCDLTVIFERASSSARDKSWEQYQFTTFRGIILNGMKTGSSRAICPGVVKHLKKDVYDRVIVMNYANPTGWLEIFALRAKRIPYLIEGDGALLSPKKGVVNFLKRGFKKYILSKAIACFSTAAEHDRYYLAHGVSPDKIYRYPFSSVMEEDIICAPLSAQEKDIIKRKLGIAEKRIVISVGQFIYRKGFDVLLRASCGLDCATGIYIVGGTPTEEMAAFVRQHNLTNVHFLPFQGQEVLRQYYRAADVFVMPTREDIWGLVVNEALAAGLPVVTTDKCVSGTELIRNGKNGYIVPTEQAEALQEAITKVLEGDCLQMSGEALRTAREYTIEKMAKAHMQILGGL